MIPKPAKSERKAEVITRITSQVRLFAVRCAISPSIAGFREAAYQHEGTRHFSRSAGCHVV
jgi:hypothetical protein